MELLSPAGNREALVAAVSCGADAVYLGYTAFGARSYAGNFDGPGLEEAVAYAHERGRRIYVTVNTLVKQCETDDLCDVLELLARCGVDAILVQDFGAARIARARFPELTLHASTQMTVNNAQGAALLKRLGFERVVPARECSLSELRRMADTGVEIEAFAHGALCVAVSGQCLFSSMIGGRSGNRGRCAQPCRLPYGLEDGTKGYLLSTKDLMLIDRLPELRDAGVYSFKLEGRMKRPEYVGIVTRAYRKALDAAQAHVPYHPDAATLESLRQIFNRGGFTEGYVMDRSNAALMSWERPNHWGVYMGKVTSVRGPLARVSLERTLGDGDGLQIRGREETELTYSGPEQSAGGSATVRAVGGHVQPGDAVYRLTDAMQMREIREAMGRESRPVSLTATLDAMPGERPVLTLDDGEGHVVTASLEQLVEPAQQRALDEAAAMKQIGKTGGTPYGIDHLTLRSEGAFMTAGMLNALRRDALEAMRRARTQVVRPNRQPVCEPCVFPERERLLLVQGERLEEAQALLDAGADAFEWLPQSYQAEALESQLKKRGTVCPWLVLPAVTQTEELDALHAFVCRHTQALSGVVVNNIGQLEKDWPVPVTGGQGLNVMNDECARFLTVLGARRLTASCELSSRELSQLMEQGGSWVLEAYGRTQLMLLSHCPRRTARGDERQDAACSSCDRQGGCPAVYTDRKGYRFPARRLKMPHGCVLRLYNSVPTDMSKAAEKLTALDCSIRLSFTDEPDGLQKELVSSFRSLLNGRPVCHNAQEGATLGHLMRGVE